MRKIYLIVMACMSMFSLKAQWRVRLQAGVVLSAQPASRDTLTAARKAGGAVSVTAVYYWGHLGISASLGWFNQKRQPDFIAPGDTLIVSGGGISGVPLLVGPEVCLACGPKVKLHLGFRMGVNPLANRGLRYTRQLQQQVVYQTTLVSKAPFTWCLSAGGHYYLNDHYGIGLTADYQHFRITMRNNDTRFTLPVTRTLRQSRQLISLDASIVYKF